MGPEHDPPSPAFRGYSSPAPVEATPLGADFATPSASLPRAPGLAQPHHPCLDIAFPAADALEPLQREFEQLQFSAAANEFLDGQGHLVSARATSGEGDSPDGVSRTECSRG